MNKRIVTSRITRLARTWPCMIVTTLHENGVVNAGTFGAYTTVGSNELGMAIGIRSDTYRNLKRDEEFVINIPSIDHAAAMEICGQHLPDTESELDAAGLTTEPAHEVDAPLIAECVANIECRFWKELEIGAHSFVVGKVLCGHIAEDAMDAEGLLDPVKARVCYAVRYPARLYSVLAEAVEV